jgi:hypothetical protein
VKRGPGRPRTRTPEEWLVWNRAQAREQKRQGREEFLPHPVRACLAAYYLKEVALRTHTRQPLSGIWSDLARKSGVDRRRIGKMRQPGWRLGPSRREILSLARATGIPLREWTKAPPKISTELLAHEREAADLAVEVERSAGEELPRPSATSEVSRAQPERSQAEPQSPDRPTRSD